MSNLLTTKEALAFLKLKDPKIITWLVQREELPRIVLGPKTHRYEVADLENLVERAKTEGLQLTVKP